MRTTTHLELRNRKLAKYTILQDFLRHERERPRPPPCRVGRGEQIEARPGNSVPRSGPHLVLSRRRIETWCISGLSIAETTGPTYFYMYVPGGLCRGGLPVVSGMHDMHYENRILGSSRLYIRRYCQEVFCLYHSNWVFFLFFPL